MYTGYELTEESRAKLYRIYPPLFRNVIAHHITEEFGVNHGDAPAQPKVVHVIGEAVSDDLKVQALLCAIDFNEDRPDGSKYHITWSIDRRRGAKPVHSNKIIHEAVRRKDAIQIEVIPRFFER
jgi:hypothetical protein